MSEKFTPSEITLLRNKRMFTLIGKQIPSPRAYLNGHVSSKYVQLVLSGEVATDTETTKAIKTLARDYLTVLCNNQATIKP